MFLCDFAEFNVSKFLPKTPSNVGSRKLAANLLREGKRYEKLIAPKPKYVRTTKSNIRKIRTGSNYPKLDTIHAITPLVLSESGIKLSNLKPTDLPDLYGLLKTKNDRGVIKNNSIGERFRLNTLSKPRKDLVSINNGFSVKRHDLTGIEKYIKTKKLTPNQKVKINETLRLQKLANEIWDNKDYENAMRAIYGNRKS